MTGGPTSKMKGISVAKVQTKRGKMKVAPTGTLKYARKRGLTAQIVTDSKAAPTACPTTAATA